MEFLVREEFGLFDVTWQQKYASHFLRVYLLNFQLCIKCAYKIAFSHGWDQIKQVSVDLNV